MIYSRSSVRELAVDSCRKAEMMPAKKIKPYLHPQNLDALTCTMADMTPASTAAA